MDTESTVNGQLNYEESFPEIASAVSNLQVNEDTSAQKPPGLSYASLVQRNQPAVQGRAVTASKSLSISNDRLSANVVKKKNENEIINSVKKEFGVLIERLQPSNKHVNLLIAGKPNAVDNAINALLERLTTPESLTVPESVGPAVFKRNAQYIENLKKQTETHVYLPVNKNGKILIYSSNSESIKNMKEQLESFLRRQEQMITQIVKIPKEFHPWIRGPFEETVKKLMEETSAEILIPSLQSSRADITVCGLPEAVKNACAKIDDIYKKRASGSVTMKIDLPKFQHEYFMADKFFHVNDILLKTDVSVELPFRNNSSNTIILRGNSNSAIGDALTLVHRVASTSIEQAIEVPAQIYRHVRMKLPKVKAIFSNVSIDIGKDRTLILKGPPTEVHKAACDFNVLMEKLLKNLKVETIEVKRRYHGSIIGRQGQRLQRYYTESGVNITIPESGDKIVLEGSPDCVELVKKDILNVVHRLENEVTSALPVRKEFHSKIIGPKGSNIQNMRSRFRVNIIVPDQNDTKEEILIRGSHDEVEKCCEYLKKFVSSMEQNDYFEEIKVPKASHRFIIGRNGMTINDIRNRTNARIEIPLPEHPDEIVRVRGSKEDVKEAVKIIEELLESNLEEYFVIPPAALNWFIDNGRIMPSIRHECGNAQLIYSADEGKIRIRGTKNDVNKAMKFLRHELENAYVNRDTAEVPLTPLQNSFVQNNLTEFFLEMQQKHDVEREFSANDEGFYVRFIGPKEGCEAAKEALQNVLANVGEIAEQYISIPSVFHDRFKEKDVLNDLKRHLKVDIVIPAHKTSNERFIIRGGRANVDTAVSKLTEMVEDWKNETTIEVPVDSCHHQFLQTRCKRRLRQIELSNNVTIKFPSVQRVDRGTEAELLHGVIPNYVTIRGRESKCEDAKDKLLELIPVEVKVEVPSQFHSRVIGRQGCEVARIKQESGITDLSVPARDSNENYVTVKGTPKCVKKAVEILKDLVNSLTAGENNYALTLNIPQNLHSMIIGRGGRTISQLRSRYRVGINVPYLNSPNDSAIVITGDRENCEAAKHEIYSILNYNEYPINKKIYLDPSTHQKLIGPDGQNIQKFNKEYKVYVQFKISRDNPDVVQVSGDSEEAVDEAIEELTRRSQECKGYTQLCVNSNSEVEGSNSRPPVPDTSNLDEFPDMISATTTTTTVAESAATVDWN